MYWSAIRTRLLVGIFTPAIRATDFSPVADPSWAGLKFLLSRAGVRKREHDALPLICFGARRRQKLSDLDAGLLKDSTRFRQPSLPLSSLFRDLFGSLGGGLACGLFCRLFGLAGRPALGHRGGLPPALAGRGFPALWGRFGGLPGGFGNLFA